MSALVVLQIDQIVIIGMVMSHGSRLLKLTVNLIDEANEFITGKELENSAAESLHPGSLLMAMYGQGKTEES